MACNALHKRSRSACYIRDSPVALARHDTGGGWRRTCAGRERRWPSFIIWRWAGRALVGWIHCRWKTPLLHPPPRLRRPMATPTSPRPVAGRPALERRRPRRVAPESPPRNRGSDQPRSRLAEGPRRADGDPRPGNPRRRAAGRRPRGALAGAPSGRNLAAGRRRPSPRPADARRRPRRRAAGDVRI